MKYIFCVLTLFVLTEIVNAQVYSAPPYYMETHQTQDSLLYQQGDDSAATAPTITQLPYNWCWCFWRPAGTPYLFVCWKDTNGIQYDTVRKVSNVTQLYAKSPLAISGTDTAYLTNGTDAQILIDSAGVASKWRTISGDEIMNDIGIATLATVNSNVGTFGNATHVGSFTVNAKGLITAASNITITAGSIPVPLQVDSGGTGRITLPAHNILTGNGTGAIDTIGVGVAGYGLISHGSTLDASFQQLGDTSVFAGGTQNLAANTTKYYSISGFSAGSLTDSAGNGVRSLLGHGITIQNIYVIARNASGSGQSYTVTIMKNGSATSTAATLSNTTSGNNSTQTTCATNDEIYVRVTSSTTALVLRGIEWSITYTIP